MLWRFNALFDKLRAHKMGLWWGKAGKIFEAKLPLNNHPLSPAEGPLCLSEGAKGTEGKWKMIMHVFKINSWMECVTCQSPPWARCTLVSFRLVVFRIWAVQRWGCLTACLHTPLWNDLPAMAPVQLWTSLGSPQAGEEQLGCLCFSKDFSTWDWALLPSFVCFLYTQFTEFFFCFGLGGLTRSYFSGSSIRSCLSRQLYRSA